MDLCEFEGSLVYKVSAKKVKTVTQTKPISKKQTKQTKKRKENEHCTLRLGNFPKFHKGPWCPNSNQYNLHLRADVLNYCAMWQRCKAMVLLAFVNTDTELSNESK